MATWYGTSMQLFPKVGAIPWANFGVYKFMENNKLESASQDDHPNLLMSRCERLIVAKSLQFLMPFLGHLAPLVLCKNILDESQKTQQPFGFQFEVRKYSTDPVAFLGNINVGQIIWKKYLSKAVVSNMMPSNEQTRLHKFLFVSIRF
jgi:hypothetical protein